MYDFLKFVDELRQREPIHVEIYYSKIMDWAIRITKKGCASVFPKSPHVGQDAILVYVMDCDMEYAFAKAHVALKKWLLENNGGY